MSQGKILFVKFGKGRFGSTISALLANHLVSRFKLAAMKIAPVLQPYFTSLGTIGLPNWQGYARIQMNNEASPPFSFRTEKDETPFCRKLASKIKNLSRLKYGTDFKQVDDQIIRRRTSWRSYNRR